MPRRIYEYPNTGHLGLYNLISTIGAFILGLGVLVTVINVVRSLKKGAIAGPDPWKANTLEWFTESPPPVNNFDVIPRIRSVEPMKDLRRQVARQTERAGEEVPVPATTTVGSASTSSGEGSGAA
jgi:cytochrome c oxidase subunit 1